KPRLMLVLLWSGTWTSTSRAVPGASLAPSGQITARTGASVAAEPLPAHVRARFRAAHAHIGSASAPVAGHQQRDVVVLGLHPPHHHVEQVIADRLHPLLAHPAQLGAQPLEPERLALPVPGLEDAV